jgi:putative transposase
MSIRKTPIIEGHVYHIYTRSIAEYRIFRSQKDYQRMLDTINFYTPVQISKKFSDFSGCLNASKEKILSEIGKSAKKVKLISFCIMPTHLHLMLEQLTDGGISKYLNLILKSYSRYFNVKYKRLGPLWESRFKNVIVESNEQFMHLTRYIHLNPVSISLVKSPEEWKYSSYNEYIDLIPDEKKICDYSGYFDMSPETYKEFVHSNISYQKELQEIKHLLLE